MGIQPGDVVGDYEVIGVIGCGGMGAVYQVEHRITRRVEAMKALSIGIGISDEEVRRFEREIQAQARLLHPNIAAVYSAVRHGDLLALVMEYVEGESLRRCLERGRLPVETALAIAADVLAALDCAHRNGVVHGDVTPANILLTPCGAAKLTDFGLSRDASTERQEAAGVPVGTPWYMAPEQVRGAVAIDARTDLYAVGAVLHEMLTGRKLFEAEDTFAILRAQVDEVPKPPSTFNSKVPAALDSLMAMALAKEPGRRVQTAAEFRSALMRIPVRRTERRRILIASAAVAMIAATSAGLVRSKRVARVAATPVPIAAPHVEPAAPNPVPPADPLPEIEVAQPKSPRARVSEPELKPSTIKAGPQKRALIPFVPPAGVAAPTTSIPVSGSDTLELPTNPVAVDLGALPAIPHPASMTPAAIPNQAAEAPPPQKPGNRFVKALGKINPFRRGSKETATDAKK